MDMKHQKKFVIHGVLLFCFTLLLSSCVHLQMTHLDDDEVEWVENFNRYVTCRFSSNYGSHSTLAVKSYGIANSRNPFYISSKGYNDYEATASISFVILQNDHLLEGYFGFRKVLPGRSLVLYTSLGDRDANELQERDVRKFEYAGKLFEECVILDSLNSHISRNSFYPFESAVEKAVISKEYGLIYYSFSDGEEFFREFD